MSAEKLILEYLSESKGKQVTRHAGVRLGFLGLPDFKYYKYQTLANRCSMLKSGGYIKEFNGTYFITPHSFAIFKSDINLLRLNVL